MEEMEDNQVVTNNVDQQNREALSSSVNSPSKSADPATSATANILAIEEVTRSLQLLMAEMQRLREDFDTKVKYDESKERLIDSLHRELQVYREGLHFKILKPVFIDLIAMYDDLGKLIDAMLAKDPSSASSQMVQNLGSFQETIEETLRRNGVDAFTLEESTFLASKQRILKVLDTSDPAQDKQIGRRVRKGFEYEGRVLRPEIVEIYKYNPVSS
jgi:molecular chaperone GrpE